MRFSLKTLIWAVILLALLFAGGVAWLPKPVAVEVATVTEGPLRVSVHEDGKTRIREKFTVSAPVSGRLSRIELDPGDLIEEGTLLAVILPSDPAILDARSQAEAAARVQAASAALQRAESSAEQARITHELNTTKYERAQQLKATNAISRDELDTTRSKYLASGQAVNTARFDVDIARFEVAMAQAAVRQFTDREEDADVQPFEIRSPVSGKVIRVFQESSKVVTVGAPLVELGDPQNLEIEVDVLSTDAVQIPLGAELTVEHWGGQAPLEGVVRVIEPGAFTKVSALGVEEQRVNVIADFTETPERIAALGDGYRVEARITVTELDRALLVPNSALFRHQGKWHVFKIVDKAAVLQPVQLGLQNDSHAEVIVGLAQEDQVVLYPSDDLTPGAKVKKVNAAFESSD